MNRLILTKPYKILEYFPNNMKFDEMHHQLSSLPPDTRRVVKLVIGGPYGESHTYNQVAKEMEITYADVANHCKKAASRLKSKGR